MQVALGELYSPSLDQIICRDGFPLPVTNPQLSERVQLNRSTVLKFLAAIKGIQGMKPKILIAKNTELVKGREKTLYLAATSYSDDEELPELVWHKPFLFRIAGAEILELSGQA